MTARDTWDRLADALEYPENGPAQRQVDYVDAFDLDDTCTLEIGWHLFGDAPERAAFLAMLREDLARAGVYERGNLPDHLPTLLRLIAREENGAAAELAAIVAPAVGQVLERLKRKQNPFAGAIADVARALEARVAVRGSRE